MHPATDWVLVQSYALIQGCGRETRPHQNGLCLCLANMAEPSVKNATATTRRELLPVLSYWCEGTLAAVHKGTKPQGQLRSSVAIYVGAIAGAVH